MKPIKKDYSDLRKGLQRLKVITAIIFLFFTVNCTLLTVNSFADIPRLINYQGKLVKKADGTPETQKKDITFRIYDSQSAPVTQAIWTETQSVTPDKGVFAVLLGSTKPNGIDLTFNVPYWLGIQVGTDEEMLPRQRLTSSAYTFNSARLDGKPVTEFSLANHTHDASNITAGLLPVARGGTGVANKTMTIIQYTGNGQDNRTITHGLGTTPAVVLIFCATDGEPFVYYSSQMAPNKTKYASNDSLYTNQVKTVDATNVTLCATRPVNGSGDKYTMICMATQ